MEKIKRIKKYFKYLRLYIKYNKDINSLYSYMLRKTSFGDESAGWYERTETWYRSE